MQGRARRDLKERLKNDVVICAEGYLFELERRGYVQAGSFVPEAVLEHPEVVDRLHRDFVHCGSDIVEAFTYYAHRERLATVGKEHLLEQMNRNALRIAKKVAEDTGTFFAGNVCNTNQYVPNRPETHETARQMFREQIQWAKEEGADFIISETNDYVGEALIALEEIKKAGMQSVVTLGCHKDEATWDGVPIVEACLQLEKAGADVVGINCHRGPDTMLPVIQKLCAQLKVPVAALPVPFRTTTEQPTMQQLEERGHRCFPVGLDPFVCTRFEIQDFAKKAKEMGVKYFGLCCGAGPHHVRALSETLGRTPPASKYSADMSKHAFLGTVASSHNKQQSTQL